jgi:hypothetical protein
MECVINYLDYTFLDRLRTRVFTNVVFMLYLLGCFLFILITICPMFAPLSSLLLDLTKREMFYPMLQLVNNYNNISNNNHKLLITSS